MSDFALDTVELKLFNALFMVVTPVSCAFSIASTPSVFALFTALNASVLAVDSADSTSSFSDEISSTALFVQISILSSALFNVARACSADTLALFALILASSAYDLDKSEYCFA